MAPIREGGGGGNWIWRGEPKATEARVEVVVGGPLYPFERQSLRYSISIEFILGAVLLTEEIRENQRAEQVEASAQHYLQRSGGNVVLSYLDESRERSQRELPANEIKLDQSILSQLKDPFQYPELTRLGIGLTGIHLYREWSFGRNTPPRLQQKADLPNHSLAEDGQNLGMVLNRLEGDPKAKRTLLAALRKLYHGIDDYYVQVEAGSVQVSLKRQPSDSGHEAVGWYSPLSMLAGHIVQPEPTATYMSRGTRTWFASLTSSPVSPTYCAKLPNGAS